NVSAVERNRGRAVEPRAVRNAAKRAGYTRLIAVDGQSPDIRVQRDARNRDCARPGDGGLRLVPRAEGQSVSGRGNSPLSHRYRDAPQISAAAKLSREQNGSVRPES